MKTILLFLSLVASLSGAEIQTTSSLTNYFSFKAPPKISPGELGGPLNGAGIGDTADDTPKRTCIILSFDTDDAFRAAIQSPLVKIYLRFRLSSITNGGSPSDISLNLLDVGRDFTNGDYTLSTPQFAWLYAPDNHSYGAIINPALIGVDQVVEVTNEIRSKIGSLSWQSPGICFGLYSLIPTDNNTRNSSQIDLSSIYLFTSSTPPAVASINIGSAIYLEVQTVAGATYFIESSSDLVYWTRNGTGIVGDGTLRRFYYSITSAAQFYRVVTAE